MNYQENCQGCPPKQFQSGFNYDCAAADEHPGENASHDAEKNKRAKPVS